jgi:hypothetical protein
MELAKLVSLKKGHSIFSSSKELKPALYKKILPNIRQIDCTIERKTIGVSS